MLVATGRTRDNAPVICLREGDQFMLRKVNVSKQKCTKIGTVTESLTGVNSIIETGKNKYMLLTTNGIYEYNSKKKSQTEMLNWIEVGIDDSIVSDAGLFEDGTIGVMTYEFGLDSHQLAYNELVPMDQADNEGKQKITLALSDYVDISLEEYIRDFNTQSQEYQVEVEYYKKEGMTDDEMIASLNADIAAGNGPDMISVMHFDFFSYAKNDVFENLYLYMEADEEFHMEDYFENILTGFDIGGKLYAVPTHYYVNTLLVPEGLTELEHWNLEEMYSFFENESPDSYIYYADGSELFYDLLTVNMDRFYNLETGHCEFNTEDFVQLLSFCKERACPDEIDLVEYIQEGKLPAYNTLLGYRDIQGAEALYQSEMESIGYPTDSGNGSTTFYSNCLLSMTSFSDCKDGVWEFIKFCLSEKQQNKKYDDVLKYFTDIYPVNRNSYEYFAQVEIDTGFIFIRDENGEIIQILPHDPYTGGINDFDYTYNAPTAEDMEAIKEIIEGIDTKIVYDNEVWPIIEEEIDPYFNSDADPWQVAENIQNRVSLFVSESR